MKNVNPLTRMDYPDPDVIRVDDTYYLISTTMYYMPGGVILRSYDLAHWEIAAYLFDELDGTPAERLEDGQNSYGKGMWAASLRYHEGRFYATFVSHGQEDTHLFTAESAEGPWEHRKIRGYFHDCSLYFEEDGRVFLVSGNTEIRLTELAPDLSGPKEGGVDTVIVRDDREAVFLGYEGSHLYKIRGRYYLTLIHWPKDKARRTEAVFSADSVTGPYEGGDVFWDDGGYCGQGIAQGGLADTPDGRWFAVLFRDSGAIGRIPVLVPVTWEGDKPVFGDDGRLPEDIEIVSTRPLHEYEPLFVSDRFLPRNTEEATPENPAGTLRKSKTRRLLSPQWQWNHVPDDARWVILPEGGLRITTGAVSANLTQARNTLTQRMCYPQCEAEVTVAFAELKDGDRAGLAAMQGCYAAICVANEGGRRYLEVVRRVEPTKGFAIGSSDSEPGTVTYREELPAGEASAETAGKVTLGIAADFTDMKDTITFFVREDGRRRAVGGEHRLYFRLDHFTGARFGLCVWSEKEAGGSACFTDFQYRSTV
ncbi:MAG: glycoside hydrolase 43 family protein [Lachnospiraceae bacterium]|nr:glycoside hydrolase 43 family protein [Lachnospiraceae bacterium]